MHDQSHWTHDPTETVADRRDTAAVEADLAAARADRDRFAARVRETVEAQLDALAAVPTATLIEHGRRAEAEAASDPFPGRCRTHDHETGRRCLLAGPHDADVPHAYTLGDALDREAAREPQEAAQTLVEDEDGAPYPGHVQDALDRIANALAGALPDVPDRDVAEVAQRAANAAAPLLLDLLPNPEAEPTTDYALALMRSTLLNTMHPDGTGTYGVDDAEAVCAALAPQVGRMLAEADARVERARTAALAEAYAGAADDPGPLDTTPTDAQWLRRLFDLPASERLAVASYLAAAGQKARECFQANHVRRLTALEDRSHRLGRVCDVLNRFGHRTGIDGSALLDAMLAVVAEPSPIDSTPIQCPERHPDTGNPCTATVPHSDAEHRAMGRERMQLFGSALQCAEAPADPLLCPECAQGKTRNCAGQALDPATDDLVPCATQAQGADQ